LARLFAVRAYNRLANGQIDKAWTDILTIQRVSEHASRGPMMIDPLVGGALHGIACGTAVDLIEHADADVDWESLLASWEIGPVAAISDGFAIGERAYVGYVVCDFLATSDSIGKSLDMFNFGEQPDALAMVVGNLRQAQLEQAFAKSEIKLDDTLRLGNHYYDQVALASDLKNAQERDAALTELESLLSADDDDSDKPAIARVLAEDPDNRSQAFARAFLGALIGPTESVVRGEYRRRACTHVVKLGLAARLYQSRSGALPRSVDELSMLVEADALIEPQTGESIGFRAMENEIVIYHWGHDRIDNGGDIDGDRPKDWGIRIRE
jgi:hypothetical protein